MKSVRENSLIMCEQDYRQKKAAYEMIYGKPLDYGFEAEDIAGWIPACMGQSDILPKYHKAEEKGGMAT